MARTGAPTRPAVTEGERPSSQANWIADADEYAAAEGEPACAAPSAAAVPLGTQMACEVATDHSSSQIHKIQMHFSALPFALPLSNSPRSTSYP